MGWVLGFFFVLVIVFVGYFFVFKRKFFRSIRSKGAFK